MISETQLQTLGAQQLRETVRAMMADLSSKSAAIERHEREAAFNRATIDKLTHEMAVLKRLKFAAKSEAFTAEQKSLLCRRRFKFEPPCRPNIEPGAEADFEKVGCG